MFKDLKKTMTREFEITDIRLMAYYRYIEFKWRKECFFIFQERYAREILKKFKMDDCKPINTLIKYAIKLSKDMKQKR